MSGPEIEKCERTPWKPETSAKPEAPKCANVREIVKKYLEDNGFDGLYYRDQCACSLKEFIHCDSELSECLPGYESPCDCGAHDFHIGPKEEQDEN